MSQSTDEEGSVAIDMELHQAALDLSQVPYFLENDFKFSLINENQLVQVGKNLCIILKK